jgi:uncharacterized protein (TIGR02001 family)
MKLQHLLLLTVGAAVGLGGSALAQDASTAAPPTAGTQPTSAPAGATSPTPAPAAAPTPDLVIAYNFGAQTDYIFRGISQTKERASGFAGIDVTYKGQFYVGTWTSNVDFSPFGDNSTNEEIDLYGGWRPTVAGFNLDLGYQYYGYVDQTAHVPEDYSEIYLKGTRGFGPLTLGASIYYSPNFPGLAKDAEYYEVNAAYTINPKWALSGAVGRQDESKAVYITGGDSVDFNYTTWNVGATYTINDHTSLDLRYWDTDEHSSGNPFHSHIVGQLKATF